MLWAIFVRCHFRLTSLDLNFQGLLFGPHVPLLHWSIGVRPVSKLDDQDATLELPGFGLSQSYLDVSLTVLQEHINLVGSMHSKTHSFVTVCERGPAMGIR